MILSDQGSHSFWAKYGKQHNVLNNVWADFRKEDSLDYVQ